MRWIVNDPFSFAAGNRMLADMNLSIELGRIQCPALVCAGTRDKMRPPELVRRVAQAIPGARYP
ncbi:MAG: alpha/beta hydrolase, partial [Steroidobacteraceae bacterium]